MNQNDYAKKYEDLSYRYTKLVEHFLGSDWYSIYWHSEDCQEEALQHIMGIYKGVKENKISRWRRRHKKCFFCKHLKHREIPTGGDYYSCKAKDKRINSPDRRRICGLFELDYKF